MIEVHRYRDGHRVDGATSIEGVHTALADGELVWVDATEVTDDELRVIAAAFGLHPLTVEDALHRRQRPRVEIFESYVFVAVRTLTVGADEALAEREVHLLSSPRFLVTIADGGPVPEVSDALVRCERQQEMLGREGGGFALYAVLDEIVDGYLDAVESLEDAADELEDVVFDGAGAVGSTTFQQRTFRVKRAVVQIRRLAGPLRAGVDMLHDQELAGPVLTPYLRDIEDHLLRVAEMADSIRDLLTSLLEVRVGQVANDLNEVMKKLSAWAGIILVPTLIAGIYGMNFAHMPELSWRIGYPLALAMMGGAAWLLHRGFKKQGWL